MGSLTYRVCLSRLYTHSPLDKLFSPGCPANWLLDPETGSDSGLILLARLEVVFDKAAIIIEAQIVPVEPVGTPSSWVLSPLVIVLKAKMVIQDGPGSSCMFPALDLDSAIFSKRLWFL